MRYFILLSIITHGLLFSLWDTMQITLTDEAIISRAGSPLNVRLHANDTSQPDAIAVEQPVKHTTALSSTAAPPPPVEPRRLPPTPVVNAAAAPVAIAQQRLPTDQATTTAATAQSPATPPPPHTPSAVAQPLASAAALQPAEAAATPTTASTASTDAMLQHKLNQAFAPYFQYPRLARKRGWQGTVELGLHVSSSGKLSNIRVMQSSGYRVLDLAAIKSLQQLGTLPEMENWLTQGYSGVFPIRYELIDG